MKNKFGIIILILAILIIGALLVYGCSSQQTTGTTTSTQATTPSSPTTTTTSAATKTLKVGVIAWYGFPIGNDMVKSLQVMADQDNQNGGLTIGGEKYTVQFIPYDNQNSETTAISDVNRLIFQDNAKFILSDPTFVDPWLPITEANKVIVCAAATTSVLPDPKNHYSFSTANPRSGSLEGDGWFHSKYPNVKTVVVALPDSPQGQSFAPTHTAMLQALGFQVTNVFFPENTQDLSSLGTKVKQLNPDWFTPAGGPPEAATKAVLDAGYTGIVFCDDDEMESGFASVFSADQLDRIAATMSDAWDWYPNPPTQVAKDFQSAYVAKYGKWDGPNVNFSNAWPALRAALQQAGTLDTDKVAAVLSSGLKFEGPNGPCQMVPDPDLGNSRTVDCVYTYWMRKWVNGQPTIIDTINLDQAVAYWNLLHKAP